MATSSNLAASINTHKSRQRVVLNKWANLTTCDRCRSKKIKCERLDEDSEVCTACKVKDLSCQTTQRPPRVAQRQVSEHSPDAALQRTELSESTLSQLLAIFFQTEDDKLSYAYAHEMQYAFEQAGRRLGQLDNLAEPLVLTMIACSTQFADLPALLGPNAPSLNNLRSFRLGVDVAQFGRRRRAICTTLIDKALALTDARGVYRKANFQSIAVLMILPRLLRYPAAFNKMEDTWRPFMSAAMEHLRAIILQRPSIVDDVKFGQIQWTIMVSDVIQSVYYGYSLVVLDNDMDDFPNMFNAPPVTTANILQYAISSNPDEFILPHTSATSRIVWIGRRIATTISIPLAKNRKVEIESFFESVKELRTMLQLLHECQSVAQQISPLALPSTLNIQNDIIGTSALICIKYAPALLSILMPPLYFHFVKYMGNIDSVRYHQDPNLITLTIDLQREMEMGSIEAVTTMASTIGALEGSETVALLTSQTSILATSHEYVLHFINLAFAVPTIEETGADHLWVRDVKIRALRQLIDAARLQQWAWCDIESEVEDCERKFERYTKSIPMQPHTVTLFGGLPLVETPGSLDWPQFMTSQPGSLSPTQYTFQSSTVAQLPDSEYGLIQNCYASTQSVRSTFPSYGHKDLMYDFEEAQVSMSMEHQSLPFMSTNTWPENVS